MKNSINGNLSPVFAVVCDWFRGQYQNELISGIEDEAKKNSARILYFAGRSIYSPDSYDVFQNAIYDLIPIQMLDGVIITGLIANYCDEAQMDEFAKRFNIIPVVSIDHKIKDVPGIFPNNQEGFDKMMSHLIADHGYRKIAFIRGPQGNHGSIERYNIYRHNLSSSGITVDERLIVNGNFSYSAGRNAIKVLFDERKVRPSEINAVVASNDLMAHGAIDELKERGIDVPGRIAITGFDDDLDAADSSLTTIRQPIYEIGQQAVLSLLDYPALKNDIFLNSQLIIRSSCGCGIIKKTNVQPAEVHINTTSSGSPEKNIIKTYTRERITDFYMHQLIFVSDALKQAMSLHELELRMQEGLSSLGIDECFLFLYEDPLKPLYGFNLTCGYNKKGIFSEVKKINLSGVQIFKELLTPTGSLSYCILPVLFRDKQFGFLFLNVNMKAWIAYETVRSQVSSTLKNIFLISEIRRINRKLKKANINLQQSEEQKTRFFINIAHETKTPLTLIKNYLEKYIQAHSKDSTSDYDLGIIKENIDILLENMINFMDAEKLKKGKILYNHNKITNLSVMIINKVILFRELSIKKQIRITLKSEEHLFVKADPWALDRILNNLMDNALKYTQPDGQIHIGLEKKDNTVILCVDDNGPGIAANKIDHIFKPYYQLSHEMSSTDGIGMGLYIVKKIADDLGAVINVQSKEGTGTNFIITLPLWNMDNKDDVKDIIDPIIPPMRLHSFKPIIEEEITAGKCTLLIVDDNISMLAFLQSSLNKKYNVCLASDVNAALEKLEKIPKPDLIISDIMMDGMDGHDFIHSLSTRNELYDIPFIFLTAKNTYAERLKGLNEGAIDFIEKPFSMEELMIKIESIINLRKKQKQQNTMEMTRKINSLLLDNSPAVVLSKSGNFDDICIQYRITAREKEVIVLILKGLINKEIASSLHLSMRTVEYHITNIYKKLGVDDRFKLLSLFKT